MTARLDKLDVMHISRSANLVIHVALTLALGLFCGNAWSAQGVITVEPRTVTSHFTAYARVVPIAVTALKAAQTGQITGLNVDPGQNVAAGTILGRLQGPEIANRLARQRAAVDKARATLTATRHSLAIEKKKQSEHLSTRQVVYNAQALLAGARSDLSAARAALSATRNNALVRAPATGTVISRAVSSGERVATGQTLLTLLPDHQLWLTASYYGADASLLRVGMRGRFFPAGSSTPIAVRIARVLPVTQPGGGRPIALRTRNKEVNWVSGEAGTVILQGAVQTAIAIPTQALILDRGQWWVLVHTPKGDRPQRVTPGASRGHDTLVTQGLSAGAQVVVDNAYLKFHGDFSRYFQQPD